MVRVDGKVILGERFHEYRQEVRLEGVGWIDVHDDDLPDLDHPGTRAFLLEDVLKAWAPGHDVVISYHALSGSIDGVTVWHRTSDTSPFTASDIGAAALMAALRAAP